VIESRGSDPPLDTTTSSFLINLPKTNIDPNKVISIAKYDINNTDKFRLLKVQSRSRSLDNNRATVIDVMIQTNPSFSNFTFTNVTLNITFDPNSLSPDSLQCNPPNCGVVNPDKKSILISLLNVNLQGGEKKMFQLKLANGGGGGAIHGGEILAKYVVDLNLSKIQISSVNCELSMRRKLRVRQSSTYQGPK